MDVECDWIVVIIVPRDVWDGDGASVVAAGSGTGLEVVGAWIEIVVSDTAGVEAGVGSTDGVGLASGDGV